MTRHRVGKIAKNTLPLLLGVILVWYSLGTATPEERDVLWDNIRLADFKWVFISLFFGILSHASRAYRWKYLLEPLGFRPRFANSFMAIMGGYLANLGLPRSGEVLRGATLTTYENVPFEKAFGTIISERIADLFMLLLIVITGLLMQTDHMLAYFSTQQVDPFFSLGVLLILMLFGIGLLHLIRRSRAEMMIRIRKYARGLLDGMQSILKMKQKKAFLFHTVFIWIMYLLMFYVIKFTLPETTGLSLAAVMAAFIIGSFAISTTNGGIGVYPLAVGAVLLLFGIDEQAGEAFGWIVWGSQTLLVVILGGLSLLLLPVFNHKK